MRKAVLLLFLIITPVLGNGNILDILEKKDNSFNLQKQLKKDIGSVFFNDKPADFIQAFESQNFEKALEIWLKEIQSSPFAKSSTGSALYSYLLFKNGFHALSLSYLFKNSQLNQINPIVSRLWKVNVDKTDLVWDYFYFPLFSDWQVFFSPEIVFKIGSKAPIHLEKDQDYIKSLLALPLDNKVDVFSLEWLFALSLIKKNDMDSAGKVLAWLLDKTKNKYRKDKINITIARLLSDIGESQAGLHYYQKVKNLSYFWFLAQEEMAWSYLSTANNSQAYSTAQALNYPVFLNQISPSMFFTIALSQIKNCDDKGAIQSLKDFKKLFLEKYSNLKKTARQKNYKNLIQSLLAFYSDNIFYYQMNKTDLLYGLRKDSRLKNDLLMYNYMKEKREGRKTNFPQLLAEEGKIIKNLETQIHKRIRFLLQIELKNIEKALKNFHFIEAEALYREYGSQAFFKLLYKDPWYKDVSLYKSESFLYFPFNRDEIWLDELSDYTASKNKNCPKGIEVL